MGWATRVLGKSSQGEQRNYRSADKVTLQWTRMSGCQFQEAISSHPHDMTCLVFCLNGQIVNVLVLGAACTLQHGSPDIASKHTQIVNTMQRHHVIDCCRCYLVLHIALQYFIAMCPCGAALAHDRETSLATAIYRHYYCSDMPQSWLFGHSVLDSDFLNKLADSIRAAAIDCGKQNKYFR